MLVLKTAPTIEPVSLAEAKLHLRLDSVDLDDQIATEQTLVPASYSVGNYTGTAIDVLGYSVLVNLDAGLCSGSAAVKLQHSDDNVTFSDVTGGAFTAVTMANDNAIQELAYTGGKRYLRAYAAVTSAACVFSVSIVKSGATSVEDNLITDLITAAREYCEVFQRRAYLTQTWELWLDEFPGVDYIQLSRPPLASVTSIEYYNTSDVKATMSASDYFVDTWSTPGCVSLNYGKSWPSTTLRPKNGVCVTYVAGETSAASVSKKVKQAMLLLIGHWYENRETVNIGNLTTKLDFTVESLLWQDRVFQ